jgi:chromosome segregation ATPase
MHSIITEKGNKPEIRPEIRPKIIPDIRPELLGVRDKFIHQIEDQIRTKKQLLLEKRRYLDKTKAENEYLAGVRNDYEKYRNYIVNEKEQQLRAMNILEEYTERLKHKTKMTEQQIQETREDQRLITNEIDRIKGDLSYLIDNETVTW